MSNAPDYEDDLVFAPKDLTIMALESEIDVILEVLLKASPSHEGWIRANYPKFMERYDVAED
jgi:hypothetical protein